MQIVLSEKEVIRLLCQGFLEKDYPLPVADKTWDCFHEKNGKLFDRDNKEHPIDIPYQIGDSLIVKELWHIWRADSESKSFDIVYKTGPGKRVFVENFEETKSRYFRKQFTWNNPVSMPESFSRMCVTVDSLTALPDLNAGWICRVRMLKAS